MIKHSHFTQMIKVLCVFLFTNTLLQAAILFEDDFESYRAGTKINMMDGWSADASYHIVEVDGNRLLHSGRDIPDAALSHVFRPDGDTYFVGMDIEFSASASNFFWIALSDSPNEERTAGAIFNVHKGQTVTSLRVYENAETAKTGLRAPYPNPSRMVMQVTVAGDYYTLKIWFDPKSVMDKPAQTIFAKMKADELNTFYARRGSVSHSAMIMDNLVIATTFDEAATSR